MKPLDLDAVRAFVLVADLASFTRAADALGTTQSAVSLKLKRLEAQLGKPLLERTPRRVTLAAVGAAFLPAARDLLDAHERALAALSSEQRRLSIGVSEHVAVPDLPAVLTGLNRHDPALMLEMHVGMSAGLLVQYDERRLDAAFVRHEPGEDPPRDDATPLFTEPLAWLAAPGWTPRAGEPLPLAVLAGPCGVRAAALRALDLAGVPWRERFTGGGVAAVAAAAAAGLAVCPLARRVAPRSLVDVGARFGLPALPDSQVALYSRVRDARSKDTLRRFADSLAGPARPAGRE
ncbi:LysR family transcriptional regulator [Burkholderia oklahomensis]|uniref:LysR family transcriptional regulator n=2 Tax=Burkholderia oklahomensis TaxID=342113 RepID=UPI0005D996EA|nr:LysR family transcriptional regulator [Burkholderia oklahomensis]AJX34658.1 bacterial regulatory helix-turn-helix, lysR family protein [Burkholderia oklahomensis C6786]AOI48347.1 LysR family transcriptional regulator [Burkholderia oklahomensis C6786]KUY52510.1 LysR family transcriptional regulator [Burkholderia oklahomensis C6786]MBI0363501.1 LysR family transcriptional regulator [Burkholderia oklahomensis]SUY27622.1 Hca operon transcriptional activator [Burkholderia oklahomensis]